MASVPVALQLYTVRDELAKDFEGTLRQVAEIGYAGVEFAGFSDIPAPRICAWLKDLNLQATAIHVPLEKLEESVEEVAEHSLVLGSNFVVVPTMPEERRRDRKKWRAAGRLLEDIARDIQDYGLRLCYHNHDFDFEKIADEYPIDILLEGLEPELVAAELDTYWIKYGGQDPVECIRKFAGRCPLIHLKDMAGDDDRSFVEIGQGTLDFDSIFQAAEEGGVEWYIVEQDKCRRPPLESARVSFEFLKSHGKA